VRCRSCQHELWNVRPGPCPECGEPFNPRTAVFERFSAHFCCPHCLEAYWGNGTDGLPDPPEFTCARCSGAVRLEEMVLRPAPGQEGREIRMDLHPFENATKGTLRRTWNTISMAISDPVRLGRSLPPRPDLMQAAIFVAIIVGVGVCTSLIPTIVGLVFQLIAVGSIDVLSMQRSDGEWMIFALSGATVVGPMLYLGVLAVLVAFVLCIVQPRERDAPMPEHVAQSSEPSAQTSELGAPTSEHAAPARDHVGARRELILRRVAACWCYASGVAALGALPCVGACALPLVVFMAPRVLFEQLAGVGVLKRTTAKILTLVCTGLVLATIVWMFFAVAMN